MTGNTEHNPLLSKVLDQLIQLFDLTSRIDAKTSQLENKQEQTSSLISGALKRNDETQKALRELQLKVNTLSARYDEDSKRKLQKFNWILSLALIIVSTICSYLLYLIR